jgi:hypothetical protein
METYDSLRIKKSLDASIDLARKNGQFVPVIFCAMHFALDIILIHRSLEFQLSL